MQANTHSTRTRDVIAMMAFLAFIAISVLASAQVKPEADVTLSPYFFVKGTVPGADEMPLKSTAAAVNIAGVIADVTVTQVYENKGQQPLEATYVFPGSTRAAVYAMTMKIGDRTVKAKIEEKGKARADYDAAVAEGKTASLLEQKRPNVFEMNVGNIMPGDVIEVQMSYTELLEPTDGVYEFVYPTVVGPRYSNVSEATASVNDSFIETPYTAEKEAPLYTLDIRTELRTGIPIQDLRSTSHEITTNFTNRGTAVVDLTQAEKTGGNRDYVLQYRLKGAQVESGVLLYEGEPLADGTPGENFFIMMMEPPQRITPQEIPAREYVFIIDVSGSMRGFPLDISKKLMNDLVGNLRPDDLFNIILFAGSSQQFSPKSELANQANINKALQFLSNTSGGGGTELLPALQQALALPTEPNYSRSFVIATDGYVSVEPAAFELIRNNLGEANFYSFGIGSSINRHLVEGMAAMGQGEAFVVLNQGEAADKANKLREYIASPVMTNINVSFEGFDAYDVEPLNAPDLLANRPIVVYGKYRGAASGKIKVKGLSGNGIYEKSFEVSESAPSNGNRGLRYLWARKRIKMLADYENLWKSPERQKEVLELGLNYNLLTEYTSFVAIDNEVRNPNGAPTSVKQPLPMPQSVSNTAVMKSCYLSAAPAQYGTATVGVTNTRDRSTGGAKRSAMKLDAASSSPPVMAESEALKEEPEISFDRKPVGEPEPFDAVDDVEPPALDSIIFSIVEEMPQFPGGQDKMMEFLRQNIKYPDIAKEAAMEGTVYLSFIVNEDGTLSDIKLLRGVHEALDKEAIRVVKLMPNWLPGKQRGNAVKTRMNIPVRFRLEQ